MAKSKKIVTTFKDLPVGKPVEISALIDSESWGSRRLTNERKNTWDVTVLLVAWQVGDGPIIREGLSLRAIDWDKESSATLVRQCPRGRAIQFTGIRPKNLGIFRPFVKLVGSVEKAKQPLVKPPTKKNATPQEITDKVFGQLKYDRKSRVYTCEKTFRNQPLSIEFEAADAEQLDTMLAAAKGLWKQRNAWFGKWRDSAFEDYMDGMVDEWWQGDRPLTRALFNKHLGWPCGLSFRMEEGVVHFCLTGLSEALYGDHGIDGWGTEVDDMEISFA
ncbi:hypothetical protein C5Y96_15745 [Blastopirellula marina]|uniref:DUF2262 domain-containing protein n=1 Tax=Blastopirellula marina TaxID=124 RepID=A0A2S8FAM5_9BACT|nr:MULTISPECIES: DUF2262 domain-containing protein [Pirellulaceae]PQO29199.1 hypothetical protein C5Y96_15745 [Blastopirellula marina]RCS50392.1 hypothetical protein DTL36_15765 [Bremerella cremea]